jgi:hypothetical protein
MRVMAVLLACTPFLLLEAGLRVFAPADGYARVNPVVDLSHLRPLFELNAGGDRMEIPLWRGNFFQPDSFLLKKPPNSRRIFVLGGSTVQGSPYSIETSFATWLKFRLQAAAPETQFEVVNCGGVSYASYRVAKILAEVLSYQPDAIVIYTGHNEFLEDREYADVREIGQARHWFTQFASHIRTVTWLNSKLSTPDTIQKTTTMPSEVDARLDHAGGLDRYVRDPSWQQGVESDFARTLEGMIKQTQAANVPLVLCVPIGDLVNTPPFKHAVHPELSSERVTQFQHAWFKVSAADASLEDRQQACAACLALDPQHAGANYVAGMQHYHQGNALQARQHLIAARDFDVCPLRATTSIVDAVIGLATHYQVPLVDMTNRFDLRNHRGDRIPDGILDPEYFVDHVHPTVSGHQEIGEQVALKIASLGWFVTMPDAQQRYDELATAHLSALGEPYFARGKQRLQGLRQWAAGRAGKLVPVKSIP